MAIGLIPLDDVLLERLLDLAVADASPDEVIPPVEGPPGWTQPRQDFFRAFHRERFGGLDAPPLFTVMYAITVDGAVAGMIRLSRLPEAGAGETGMWLGRSYRRRGLAADAVRLVVAAAGRAGLAAVRAHTTVDNLAAQATLRRAGASLRPGGEPGQLDADLHP